MFRLVMQDEARHVGYGMQHLSWVLDHFPEKREVIHRHLDEAENFVFGGGYAIEVLEPFIILSGKGMQHDNIQQGLKITAQFKIKQIDEYFERLDKCGLPERRERSKLALMNEMTRAAVAQASADGLLRREELLRGPGADGARPAGDSGDLTLTWWDAPTERVRVRARRLRAAASPTPTATSARTAMGPARSSSATTTAWRRAARRWFPAAARPRLHGQSQERRLVGQRRGALRGVEGAPLGAGGRCRLGGAQSPPVAAPSSRRRWRSSAPRSRRSRWW